jgi:hypothetical protein
METPKNANNTHLKPVNPALMAAIRAWRGNVPLPKLTGKPIVFRWKEPTPPDDIHPDDWVDPLPIHPKRLPSRYRLFRMRKGQCAAVLIMQILASDLEIEGARWGRFEVTGDSEERKRIARNARRRKTRALDSALECGLWKNGRWQIGNLWTLNETSRRGM